MKPCLDCVRKHLATARAYLRESRMGYPSRIWDCIGEMRLAEDESQVQYQELADKIRDERMRYVTFICNHENAMPLQEGETCIIYNAFMEQDRIGELIDEASRIAYEKRNAKLVPRLEVLDIETIDKPTELIQLSDGKYFPSFTEWSDQHKTAVAHIKLEGRRRMYTFECERFMRKHYGLKE